MVKRVSLDLKNQSAYLAKYNLLKVKYLLKMRQKSHEIQIQVSPSVNLAARDCKLLLALNSLI